VLVGCHHHLGTSPGMFFHLLQEEPLPPVILHEHSYGQETLQPRRPCLERPLLV